MLSFCDLDGTFVQTSRHISEGTTTHLVYHSATNKKLVMTDRQLTLFNFLNEKTIVIPVTARSLESLQRLKSHMPFHHYKVCEHGAYIYDKDNKLVDGYSDYMTDLLAPVQDQMIKASNCVDLFLRNSIFNGLRTRAVALIDTVLIVEGSAATEEHAKIIVSNVENLNLPDLHVARNGKGFSITAFSDSYKQLACQYLVENVAEYKDLPSMGFGDSISDLSFMGGCDFAVVPTQKSTQIKLI